MRTGVRVSFVVLADLAALGLALVLFALFHHVLPGTVSVGMGKTPGVNAVFDFPGRFTDGGVEESREEDRYHYRDESLDLTVSRHREKNGEGKDVSYVLADFYIKDLSRFRTAFAGGEFITGVDDSVVNMARENNALLAASGDYCGVRKTSVVIRNGEVFRRTKAHEICVLYRSGELQTFRFADFSVDAAVARGVWQAWDFGPCLLLPDGSPRTEFHPGIAGENPRMILGYYEPGHYCLAAVDGRQKSSAGLTLPACAELMARLGCRAAYNLDGGHSAVMTLKGSIVNSPSKPGGRNISDVLYLTGRETEE
ncbi:MAG: phosphodiester glycosidase family protein [Clostridia bacterium]|nr:phosphodiester glycosidase family protein [Clostridia bacterium]